MRSIISVGVLAMMVAGVAMAQQYPSRPVRIIVSEPGSVPDSVARSIAEGIRGPLGQAVIVDNRRPLLIPEILVKAAPDGYTIALGGTIFWTQALLQKRPSYDPVKDMAPITTVVSSPAILVVHPSIPAKSVRELINLAKSRPGMLNYAQGPPGGSVHLAGELFKMLAGIDMVFVPYGSASLGVNATIAGESHLMMYSTINLIPHVKSGRLRALAVTSSQPTALVPGVPTVAASGLPGYEYVSTVGVFAPARTPISIIDRLHREIVGVVLRPEVKERFFNLGAEVVGSTPAQLRERTRSQVALWSKVIRDAGIETQ